MSKKCMLNVRSTINFQKKNNKISKFTKDLFYDKDKNDTKQIHNF